MSFKHLSVVLASFIFFASCGKQTANLPVHNSKPTSISDLKDCHSTEDGSISCLSLSGEVVILPLPATFPPSAKCNKCIGKLESNIWNFKCPNGMTFSFPAPKDGAKGDKGDTGSQGVQGAPGKDGISCTQELLTTGNVKITCANGSSELSKGAKGDKGDTGLKGDKGDKGDSCSFVYKNGVPAIKCGDEVTILKCGVSSCWSFGAKGNVYTIPNTTISMPNFSTMTPEESVSLDSFAMFNQASHFGFPGLPSRQEWYGIQFTGFIEIPACPNNTCVFRLTSDDGSKLYIDEQLVVNHDGLHSPSAKTGSVAALPGWHFFTLNYFQGPRTQIALALEISTDSGTSFRTVDQAELKYNLD